MVMEMSKILRRRHPSESNRQEGDTLIGAPIIMIRVRYSVIRETFLSRLPLAFRGIRLNKI